MMAAPADRTDSTPRPSAWFTDAINAPVETFRADVDGVMIVCSAWGDPLAPAAVLVHGAAAHRRWWDHIGPYLTAGRRVVALDLSGHGDSARRPAYHLTDWMDEVMAVAAASGPGAVLIGHSLGAVVAVRAALRAQQRGESVPDVILIDPPPGMGSYPPPGERMGRRPLKVYPTRAAARARYVFVPDSPRVPAHVEDYVAEHSVRAVDGGWSWAFDPEVFGRPAEESLPHVNLAAQLAFVRAENGLISSDAARALCSQLGHPDRYVEIPGAGHHVLLDDALAVIATVRATLASWQSGPRERSQ